MASVVALAEAGKRAERRVEVEHAGGKAGEVRAGNVDLHWVQGARRGVVAEVDELPAGKVTVWCTPAPTTKSRARAARSGPGAEASTDVTPIASRAGTASDGTSSGSGTRSRPG
jgi:hypothetical protein